MKFMKIQDFVFFVIISIILVWSMQRGISGYLQTPPDKGAIIVYGSKTCPWCIKQEAYLKYTGIPYDFIDCTQEKCPEFVDSYPTISMNGQILKGFSEL